MRTRFCLVMLAVSSAVVLHGAPASAQIHKPDPYRWCAQYGPPGGENCGFLTYQQCRETISGMGGFCVPNPFYTGPAHRPDRIRHRGPPRY